MEILTQTEVRLRFLELCEKIKAGAIFIYPTDTIYGIGCSATDAKAVDKLRKIKGDRPTKPFSIIAPSLKWVSKNCKVSPNAEKWLEQLPGAYTIVLELENQKAIAKNVIPEVETIGIRYPDHWINRFVEELGIPIITTSANKSGEPFMINLENLDPDLEPYVEFMIYEGEKEARPSKIVHPERDEVIVREK